MKRFIKDISAFCFCQSLILSFSILAFRPTTQDYLAGNLDKHSLASMTNPPRIVFIGGSNLTFGLNSERIHTEFGYPVVNMALSGMTGTDFMLNEGREVLKKGDIAVLSLEYDMFHADAVDPVLWEVSLRRLRNWRYISLRQYKWLLDNGLDVFKIITRSVPALGLAERVSAPSKPPYTRDSFNRYGDVAAYRESLSNEWDINWNHFPNAYTKGQIERLNIFYEYCLAKGVKVFFSYSPFPESLCKKWQGSLRQFVLLLNEKLTIPILGTPAETCFAD